MNIPPRNYKENSSAGGKARRNIAERKLTSGARYVLSEESKVGAARMWGVPSVSVGCPRDAV